MTIQPSTLTELDSDHESSHQKVMDINDTLADESLILNKSERKARKTLAKLGLKKVTGISRVTMRRFKSQQFFVIANAEVFKSATANVYIVFGEAKTEETAPGLNLGGGGAGGGMGVGGGFGAESMVSAGKQVAGKITDMNEDDQEPMDETGLDPSDIETVMTQVNCSRNRAVKALKENDGDLINAIISAS
ncbi:NAC domain-containing protein [Melampsora americana]|nr:NAC domain-containing protein [Melampsora americana]